MKELGMEKGMDIFQQLEAIDKAVAENREKGGDEGAFLSKYFQDVREWGGARTAINEGIRQGGFARSEAEAQSVGAETAEAEQKKYLGGQEGRAASDRSELIRTQRERAGKYVELRHMQSEATRALVGSGELEVPEDMWNAIQSGAEASFGHGSREEQQVRKLTASNLNMGLSGYSKGREYLAEKGSLGGASDEARLGEAANLLRDLRDEARKTRELQERVAAAAKDKVSAPLSASPTGGGGKRQ
jgi:hypothetical protein